MKIPVHEFPVCIDFIPFMEELEKKYGWKYRDMAGRFSKEAHLEQDALKLEWMNANGYAGKWHVLDSPTGSSMSDWPADSEEMKLRIEINTKFQPIEEKIKRPYQDVWHWMLENPFAELYRGGVNYLDISFYLDDDDTPEYVRLVLRAIEGETKNHPAAGADGISFFIDW